jgi:hypothetical protein
MKITKDKPMFYLVLIVGAFILIGMIISIGALVS